MTGQFRVTVDGPWPIEGAPIVVTADAARYLAALGYIAPELLAALILSAASEIATLPECQRPMYIEQFCNNLKGNETTT